MGRWLLLPARIGVHIRLCIQEHAGLDSSVNYKTIENRSSAMYCKIIHEGVYERTYRNEVEASKSNS